MGAITSGAVELGGVVGVVSFPPINKNFNVASYPGLFSSYEQQRNFFKESDAGSKICLLYTSPSPRDATLSRMPSSA